MPRPSSTASRVSTNGEVALEAVNISLTVQNLDYDTIVANKTLLADFTMVVKETISGEAGAGILPDHIQVNLSKGSGHINAKITPPTSARTSASSLKATLSSSKHLVFNLVANLQRVSGIDAATTGTISITDVNVQKAEDVARDSPRVIMEAALQQGAASSAAAREELIRSVLEDAEACASTSAVQVDRLSDAQQEPGSPSKRPENAGSVGGASSGSLKWKAERVPPGEITKTITGLDLSQANPLQQLHFQTIRELVRERDEAVVKCALAARRLYIRAWRCRIALLARHKAKGAGA